MVASTLRLRRATAATSSFPSLQPGELALNAFNGELAGGAQDGNPVILTAVRQFLVTALYQQNALVAYQGQIWQCRVAGTTGPFKPIEWQQITGVTFNQGVFNPTPVLTSGYMCKANDWCRVDIRASVVEIELPAAPEDGISVRITDVAANFVNNPCTVLHGAEFINSQSQDLVLQTVKDVILLYSLNLGWASVP